MPYYRHNTEKILYSLPDEPPVIPITFKKKPAGWTIAATMEITYAENPIDRKTGHLTKPTSKAAVTRFEAKDSREEALRDYFLRWTRNTTEITADEYRRLRQEYSQTTPPPLEAW